MHIIHACLLDFSQKASISCNSKSTYILRAILRARGEVHKYSALASRDHHATLAKARVSCKASTALLLHAEIPATRARKSTVNERALWFKDSQKFGGDVEWNLTGLSLWALIMHPLTVQEGLHIYEPAGSKAGYLVSLTLASTSQLLCDSFDPPQNSERLCSGSESTSDHGQLINPVS